MARPKRKAARQQPDSDDEGGAAKGGGAAAAEADGGAAGEEAASNYAGKPLPMHIKAFLQVIMSHKSLSDEAANELYKRCCENFGKAELGQREGALAAALKLANAQLKLLDLEIKGVNMPSRDGSAEQNRHYAIANLHVDDIAKKFGTSFVGWQLEAFKKILDLFSPEDDVGRCSAAPSGGRYSVVADKDVAAVKANNVSQADLAAFVGQLCDDKWLQAENKKATCYSLGPRCFIELGTLLQDRSITVPQILFF